MSITEQTPLRLSEDITHQSMGADEDTVILSLSSGTLYTCNETTADFLHAVDGHRTFGQIVDLLEQRYEVSREQLQADMTTLAEMLMQENILLAET